MKKLTEFGKLVRTLRIKNGLSEKNFAEKVKKSQSYISAIEGKAIPVLTFDFISACMDTFNLEGEERHKFLVSAMECSKEMKIPLDYVSIIEQKRFIKLLAYLLDNYNPPFQPDQSWVGNCLYILRNDVAHTPL
jgi:transcriptional regulator with XRE-family HTH domain